MTTETPQQKAAVPVKPMPTGGEVMAIVPQTFDELQRVASVIVNGNLSTLVDTRTKGNETLEQLHKRNLAKVSIVLMAGSELGLPPMVALRSFTVINNRPALYADGNVAVVRKAKTGDGTKIAEYVKQGFEYVYDYICPACGSIHKSEKLATTHFMIKHRDIVATLPEAFELEFERTDATDRSYGWCEAKRSDTGEIFIEKFSIEDAKVAKLWDDRQTVKRMVWEGPSGSRQEVERDVENDAPWHRFPKRMMIWRATGWCLRWLFADVLGGMPDEYEARDIEGMIDITPQPPPSRPTPPDAPPPPADEDVDQTATAPADGATQEAESATQEGMTLAEADVARQAELQNSDRPAGAENEVDGAENPTQAGGTDATSTTSTAEQAAESSATMTADEQPPAAPPPPEEPPEPGSDEWFERLEIYLKDPDVKSADDIEALWVEMDIESELSSTSENIMQRADDLKKHHLARVGGQGDLLGGQ